MVVVVVIMAVHHTSFISISIGVWGVSGLLPYY